VAYKRRSRACAPRLHEVVQIRNVPGDAERFAAAPTLERLNNAK